MNRKHYFGLCLCLLLAIARAPASAQRAGSTPSPAKRATNASAPAQRARSIEKDPDDISWHGFRPNRLLKRPPPIDLNAIQNPGGGLLAPNLLLTPGSGNWQLIGPGALGGAFDGATVSGRIASIAADRTNANTIYISAAGGGVWKTTDGGASWSPLTDDQAVLAMGSIAVDPTNSNILYAGTGEPNFGLDCFYGYGILKSTDGGTTWTNIGPTQFTQARLATAKIVIDGTDSTGNTVYVTGVSAANGYYGLFGVYKTTNGGTTWTNTTSSLTSSPACDLVMDPTNNQVLYAAVGDMYGESDAGVYKTTNGGSSWSLAGNYPKGLSNGRTALAISATNHLEIFALVGEVQPMDGLKYIQKSTDGGTTWSTVSTGSIGNFLSTQGFYDLAIAIDPTNANTIYAAGDHYGGANVIMSTNGGSTWADISNYGPNGPHSDEHALAFDANGKLLSGSDGGIWRLAGVSPVTWTNLNGNLSTIQFEGIALHPTNVDIAYGGSQDNGTEKYSGTDVWSEVRSGDGGITRVDQTNPNTVYHEYYSVSIERSDDGGNTWTSITSGLAGNSYNFYVPYVLDPANTSRVLYGTNYLNVSTNKGASWTTIGTPGSGGFNTTNHNIDSIGVYGNTTYVTCGPHIYVTFNGGTTWTDVSNPSISSQYDSYADIAVDPTNTSRAFLVRPIFNNYGSSSVGHVFMTTNGGTSWTDITGNLSDIPANAVRFDPTSSTLYVGTDAGVYSSTNLGGVWTLFGSGLPNARVIALELNTGLGILAAGTHGRSMWEISTGPPAPIISSISPATIPAGTANIKLTVAGSNFVSGAKVTWNGSNLATTFVSSSKLTAVVPAADHTVAGTATVQVVNPGGSSSNTMTVTITTAVASVTILPNPVAGSNTATGTVKLTNTTTTNSSVKLTSSDTAVATVPASVTVLANKSSATFIVTTSAVSTAGKSTIKASFGGIVASRVLTVSPIGAASVKLSSSSVIGGGSVTATVTLQAKAAPGAISVTASSSNTNVATITPATFSIAAGAQTGTFTVNTSAVTANTTVTITATANGKSATTKLTVKP